MTNHEIVESMRVSARKMRLWPDYVIAHEVKDEIMSEAERLEAEADALERSGAKTECADAANEITLEVRFESASTNAPIERLRVSSGNSEFLCDYCAKDKQQPALSFVYGGDRVELCHGCIADLAPAFIATVRFHRRLLDKYLHTKKLRGEGES